MTTSLVELLGATFVAFVTVVTDVREGCGDLIAGGAWFGTITLLIILLITGGGLLMSGRMMRGRWSGSSSFMAGALPGGLTACMSFFLAPVSFTAVQLV